MVSETHFIALPLDGQGSPWRNPGPFPPRIAEESEACLSANSVVLFQIAIPVVTLFLVREYFQSIAPTPSRVYGLCSCAYCCLVDARPCGSCSRCPGSGGVRLGLELTGSWLFFYGRWIGTDGICVTRFISCLFRGFLLRCMYVFMCVYVLYEFMCTRCMQVILEARGHWIPWNWNYR